ncbi:hypothetical protein [uncultured Nostoc sp.]|uniref:hypothetical protein n=1 Tax=uncultured Nostoc sp. TaxID=340711 RepID=UPI0035C9997C
MKLFGILPLVVGSAAGMLATTSPAHAFDNNPSDPSNFSFFNSSDPSVLTHTDGFGDSDRLITYYGWLWVATFLKLYGFYIVVEILVYIIRNIFLF